MVRFIKKNYFAIFPILIMAIVFGTKNILYYTIDDVYMSEIANSFATNVHSEHLVFISPYYGYIMKVLYNLVPQIDWFAVTYVLLTTLAFCMLFRITKSYNHKTLWICALSIIQFRFCMRLSFTTISFLLGTSAILWGLEYIRGIKKETIKHVLLVFLCLFFAFGMRRGSATIGIVFLLAPLYIAGVLRKRNSITSIILILALCFISDGAVKTINETYKNRIPEGTYFNQFARYRAKVSDGGILSYEDNIEHFKEIGISENDLLLCENYIYSDKTVFSEYNMKEIANSRNYNEKYNIDVISILIGMLKTREVVEYLAVCLLLAIAFKQRRTDIIALVLMTCAAWGYFFFIRRPMHNVMYSVYIMGVISATYIAMQQFSMQYESGSFNRGAKRIVPCVLAALLLCVAFRGMEVKQLNEETPYQQSVRSYSEDNSGRVLLTSPSIRNKLTNRSIVLSKEKKDPINVYNIMGDWYTYTYYWYDIVNRLELEEYNDSAIKSVIDERVDILSESEDLPRMIAIYLKEHYKIECEWKAVDQIYGTDLSVYRFTTNSLD